MRAFPDQHFPPCTTDAASESSVCSGPWRRAIVLLTPTLSSAILYAYCFPPHSVRPLAWIALCPFFAAAARAQPRCAALLGLCWSIAAAYGVGWWFPGMIVDYFELPSAAGWIGFVGAATAFAGVYYAAFAGWLSWSARCGVVNPLLIAMGWGVCEFARARLFVPNPWALTGYALVGTEPLVQLADLAGPYGIGMLVAAVNGVIAGAFVPSLRGRRYLVSCIGISLACIGAAGYGEWRLSQSFGSGQPITVTVIQGAIDRRFRWRQEYQSLGLQRYLSLSNKAVLDQPDLVVWPENAVGFYPQWKSVEQARLLRASEVLGADLLLGAPHFAVTPDGTFFYNSAFLVRAGTIAWRYDKLRPLPFAERPLVGSLLGPPDTASTPGRDLGLVRIAGTEVGVSICVESMYPDLTRGLARAGAELLVVLSNDSWFGNIGPAQHLLDVATLRAVETRRYLVRATSTGVSAIVDPHGRPHGRIGVGEVGLRTQTLRGSTTSTPYQRWGDAPCWLVVALVIMIIGRAYRRGERARSAGDV